MKYACEHGNASAVRHFAKILGKSINESTVRSMIKQYLRELDHSPYTILTELLKCKTGRPLLLGKYDEEVLNYVCKLRKSGDIVNGQILIAGAKGILQQKAKNLLRENGGHIDLDRPWAESFLRRVEYVCRKGTKAARKLPFDFIDNKHEFLKCVEDIIKKWSISAELVINFDQTNVSIIPCGNWTMNELGKYTI